jgi:uncharacterized protein YndB with AHSA1/START domain
MPLKMNTNLKENIKIEVHVIVDATIDKVWKTWTTPADIIRWNAASDDWHTTRATIDLRVGGNFMSRMEAKDGSFGFDFEGIFDEVIINDSIAYHLADDRKVKIKFTSLGNATKVTETFDAENTNSIELQKNGWQSILNNFKKYAETKSVPA